MTDRFGDLPVGDLPAGEPYEAGALDTEAGFSQFDRSLRNRRTIAFDAEAQSLVVLGFLLAQNATSAARHQEDPTYSDADTEATDPSDDADPPRRS